MKARQFVPLLLALMLAGAAQAATWTAIDVPGAIGTQALGINSAGDIVGFYTDSGHHSHGFLLKNGNFTTIDVPGSFQTVARGINDSGLIVGSYDAIDFPRGFLFDGQNFTILDARPGNDGTIATGINNAGEVVGYWGCFCSNPDFHGFTWVTGFFTTIEVFPTGETIISGISSNGDHIVGFDPFSFKNFARNAQGADRKFSLPGSGVVLGVNNHKVSVGSNVDPSFNWGFKFNLNSKIYTKLRFPGAVWTFAQGTNDAKQVVGYYQDKANVQHGFLRTP